MNINIKATNTTLTDSIRANIEDKLSVLDKFLGPEDKIFAEVEVETKHQSGDIYRAEVRIHPHGYYAEAKGSDYYAALDLVIPKIKEQLAKHKDKKVSLRRKIGNWFKRSR